MTGFDISWYRAAYYVSIPEYGGGHVYKAEEVKALHRKITDKIHLTQIADSGMSNAECLEWIRKELSEDNLQVPTR
jgi:hypothetical protein